MCEQVSLSWSVVYDGHGGANRCHCCTALCVMVTEAAQHQSSSNSSSSSSLNVLMCCSDSCRLSPCLTVMEVWTGVIVVLCCVWWWCSSNGVLWVYVLGSSTAPKQQQQQWRIMVTMYTGVVCHTTPCLMVTEEAEHQSMRLSICIKSLLTNFLRVM